MPRPEQQPPAPNRTASVRLERPKRDRMSNGKTRLQQRRSFDSNDNYLFVYFFLPFVCASLYAKFSRTHASS